MQAAKGLRSTPKIQCQFIAGHTCADATDNSETLEGLQAESAFATWSAGA